MLEKQKKTVDFREYWQIFTRRKYFFIIPFVLFMIAGIIVSIVSKPVYQSSTIIQVSQNQMLSQSMRRLLPGITPTERLNNLRRLITSRMYLKRLIETLNLNQDPKVRSLAEKKQNDFPDLSVDEIVELFWLDLLRKNISVKQMGENFIQIRAEGNTSDFVFNLVKMITQIFIDESLRLEVGGIRGAIEFSSEQLAIYKKKLADSEERLRKFKEQIVAERLDESNSSSAFMEQVDAMLAGADFDLREAKNRLKFYQSKIREQNIQYRLPNNRLLTSLKSQLLDAHLKLSKLKLQYSWQDVKVLKLSSEIEDLQAKIRNELERAIRSRQSIEDSAIVNLIVEKEIAAMDVEFLNRKRNALAEMAKPLKTRATKAPSISLTLSRLEREVEANREIYQMLLQQTRGSEIEEALQKTSAEFKFRIIEPAIKPIAPVKPNRIRIIIMSIVLGTVIGIGFIYLLETIDHSFKKVEAIEQYLQLPVLGTIPPIEMTVNRSNGKKKILKV